MPYLFNKGDIYQASFPFEEDETQTKDRAVFVWGMHSNQQEVLVSKITGSIRGSKWEVLLQPSEASGLTKPCVVCVDQTKYIPVSVFLFPRGTLNVFQIAEISTFLKEYLTESK